MSRPYYIINGITCFRIVAAPLLFYLIIKGEIEPFKWLLGISFLTDAIDGYLARKFNVTSIFGSRLDSIGDDLTVFAAVTGLFAFRMDFVKEELILLASLLVLFFIQIICSLVRYRKLSSFHTYLAKIAAVLQGVFLLLAFFFTEPLYVLFYIACFLTFLDLVEEIVLVFILSEWEANVKGIYWILKRDQKDQ